MKTKLLLIIMLIALSCSGCGNWMCDNLGLFCPDDPTSNPEFNTGEDIDSAVDVIRKSSNDIEEASADIAKEANNINQAASEVQNKIPTEIKSKVDSYLNNIKKSSTSILKDTTKINKAAADLISAESLLGNASDKVSVTEDALDDMTRERDQAIKDRDEALAAKNSQLHKALRWLIVGCIVAAAGLGMFGFMYGSKLSLTLSATCVIIMSIAVFVETYFIVIVIFGGIVLLGLIGALVWNIIIQKRAFKEVVSTVEVTKTGLTPDKKEEIFGKDGEIGLMNKIQSTSTINLIKKEKSKMLLWNTMKNKKDS